MPRTKSRPPTHFFALLMGVGSAIACVSGTNPGDDGDDGDDVTTCEPACPPGYGCNKGVCIQTPGSGGSATGGASNGGSSGAPTGGVSGVGGSGQGGTGNDGGIGGTLPTGGSAGTPATGGAFPTGGSAGTPATGGTGGQGGTVPTGGTAGGGSSAGGSAGKGGMNMGGTGGKGGSSGSASGGTGNVAGATSCNIGGQHNGNGSFTWYHFSQGTHQENGQYVTACGYRGSANGTVDTVQNISNTAPASNQYFVAIPSNSNTDFNTSQYCGACVELTGQNGTKVVATVIDSCPRTGPVQNPRCVDGHLDVSKTAFDRLGFSRGDPMNTTWRFVPCPVGNMKINTRMKSGNNNEFFVEGGITAVTSVSVNGTMATRTSYGAWHINSAVPSGAMLTISDRGGSGRVSLTVPLNNASTSNQDTGQQFQGCL
ncbi:MAG TPA: hypothetical protein VFZ53_19350 [Polyangiaceae bacterium]